MPESALAWAAPGLGASPDGLPSPLNRALAAAQRASAPLAARETADMPARGVRPKGFPFHSVHSPSRAEPQRPGPEPPLAEAAMPGAAGEAGCMRQNSGDRAKAARDGGEKKGLVFAAQTTAGKLGQLLGKAFATLASSSACGKDAAWQRQVRLA